MFSAHELEKINPQLADYKPGTDITALLVGFVDEIEGDIGKLILKEDERKNSFISVNISAEYLQQRGLSHHPGSNFCSLVEYDDVNGRRRLEFVKLTEG